VTHLYAVPTAAMYQKADLVRKNTTLLQEKSICMKEDGTIRIIVMSDTHGDYTVSNQVIERELPFDYLIHCGDAQADPESFLEHRVEYGLLAVKGNCDWFVDLPEARLQEFGFYKVLIVHGHMQDVHNGHRYLLESAKRNFADVVLYGHTHTPLVKRYEDQGVLVVNPGSLTQNRPHGTPGSYAVLTISEDDLPQAQIVYLDA